MNARKSISLGFAFSLFILPLITGCASTPEGAFASPDEAVTALVTALRKHDQKQIEQILGPGCDDVLNSGDEVADQQAQEHFLASYDEKHHIDLDGENTATLALGNNDWPMPIPLVRDEATKKWVFDTETGKDEIINRRIGRNELTVMEVCKAICDAQREYAQRDPNGDGVPEYARKIISDPAKKNGLFWETTEGERPSPLGVLVAEAEAEGYYTGPSRNGAPRPYHGYLYRIITSQGAHAPGGAMDYVVNGKLIGGFAVVAWPADYGNSGIMTFMASYNGDVYQRDKGDDTDKLAREISTYDPGPEWKKCEQTDAP